MPEKPLFAKPETHRREGADGVFYLESGYDLPPSSRAVGEWLIDWAEKTPDAVFLAERSADRSSWSELSYAAALAEVERLASWLLDSGAGPENPVAILSENSVDQALLTLAAMQVGIPAATLSPAYALLSSDHAKLKAMIELITPAVIFVSDAVAYAKALAAIAPLHQAKIIASRPDGGDGVTALASLSGKASKHQLAAAFAAVGPETVAKLLFTSGSTGMPKAVINTQLMLTTNQAANRVVWPFLLDKPPVIVDWLPWSHTFGSNFNFFMVLRNGGALYIDDGRPAPGLINRTAENIKSVRPSLCFNVPRGYDLLAQLMEEDSDLATIFYQMQLIFYAGAALPQSLWEQMMAQSERSTGRITPLVCAWGSTETAPAATHCHFQAPVSGNIGVPVPGTSLKLVPNQGKIEVRLKGPNITPGYFRNPQMTKAAFDEEGYYCIGDAVRLADPDDPSKGLFFDGRVSEDFKLLSGTWVSSGALRLAGIDALAPLAQDIVVAGHDRDEVGFLIFVNEAAARALLAEKGIPAADTLALADIIHHPEIRASLAAGLAKLKAASGEASSRHAARARLLASPADADAGEITDKAYLNQRQILQSRAADLAALFSDDEAAFVRPA
jgi:feruloyl-CoA synthase